MIDMALMDLNPRYSVRAIKHPTRSWVADADGYVSLRELDYRLPNTKIESCALALQFTLRQPKSLLQLCKKLPGTIRESWPPKSLQNQKIILINASAES